MTDTPLFDVNAPLIFPDDSPRTRRTDPVTSHTAADTNRASLPDSRALVWGFLMTHGPLTQPEIIAKARAVGARYTDSRLRSAVSEMVEDGRVEATGFYRLTENGRRAIVWQRTGGDVA